MLSKVFLLVVCLYLVQASFVDEAEVQADGVSNFAAVLSRSRRSCGPNECNAHCKNMGYVRGVCIGTYCQCRSQRRRSIDANIENNTEPDHLEEDLSLSSIEENFASESESSVDDVTKSRSARATCGYDACNVFCRKLGHARGVCIGNLCQCRFRKRRSLPEVQPAQELSSDVTHSANEVLSRSRRSCGASECNTHCKKLGHARGVCIGTYCQCRSR